MAIVDSAITYRILRILVTPWVKQKAFKFGIINDKGLPLKKYSELNSIEEQNSYTILFRMIFRLKRIIEKVPVGNKQFVSYAAALALIKECVELEQEPLNLESMFVEVCQFEDLDTDLIESFINSQEQKTFMQFREDAGIVANSTANVVATGDDKQTVIPKKKTKIQRRVLPQ